MTLFRQCRRPNGQLKFLKKVVLVVCCLGIALIIFHSEELLHDARPSGVTPSQPPAAHHNLWSQIMALRMEKRRQKLQQHCASLGLSTRGNDSLHRPNVWEFLINRPYRLVWCNVFKAASTSWMYNFNILAGYSPQFLDSTKDVPIELARRKYPRPTLGDLEAALNDSTSFLIIRHPFERLLSAYRDKIEFALPNTFYYNLGSHIVTKYRHNPRNQLKKTSIFYFLKRRQQRPTFPEFVQFLVDFYQTGQPMDEHWTPITTLCTPCQVRFDIIMKFETLHDDQNYLIHKMDLQNQIKPQWKNPTTRGKKISGLLKKYYAQLNASEVLELLHIYRHDFYLFDYNLDDYLKYFDAGQEITPGKFSYFLE